MKTRTVNLTIQKWGNSLAVRIPSVLAHSAHFEAGTPVELVLEEDNRLVVRSTGKRKLTLAERLELFDPKKHSGEIMATENVGLEKFK